MFSFWSTQFSTFISTFYVNVFNTNWNSLLLTSDYILSNFHNLHGNLDYIAIAFDTSQIDTERCLLELTLHPKESTRILAECVSACKKCRAWSNITLSTGNSFAKFDNKTFVIVSDFPFEMLRSCNLIANESGTVHRHPVKKWFGLGCGAIWQPLHRISAAIYAVDHTAILPIILRQ